MRYLFLLFVLNITLHFSQTPGEKRYTSSIQDNLKSSPSTSVKSGPDLENWPPPLQECIVINEVDEYFICASSGINTAAISAMVYSFLNGEGPGNFNISLHPSQSDADNKTNPISPFIFLTTTDYDKVIFIRIERKVDTSCFVISSFRLVITTNPPTNQVSDWEACKSSAASTYSFDLSLKDAEVIGNLNASDYKVFYYKNETDAIARTNELSTLYSIANTSTIYYRLESRGINECFSTGSFQLILNSAPTLNPIADQYFCTNSGIDYSELEAVMAASLSSGSAQDYNFSLYQSQTDAQNSSNPVSANYFSSILNLNKEFFIRAENKYNSPCFSTISFNLIITQAPVLVALPDWLVCANESDGTYANNFNEKASDALNGLDSTLYSVTYYLNETDAHEARNPLDNAYNLSGEQIIYVRVTSDINPDCYAVSPQKFSVVERIDLNGITDYAICTSTGVTVEDIDEMTSELLPNQNPNNYEIRLFQTESASNSDGAGNSLDSLLGITDYDAPIYLRVETLGASSCFEVTSFRLSIYSIPVVGEISDWSVCSGLSDTYSFDLNLKNSEILANLDATQVNLTYYFTEEDAIAQINLISSAVNVSTEQKVYFRISNDKAPDCFYIADFNLLLSNTLDLDSITDLEKCGLDGFSNFNLENKKAELKQQFGNQYSIEFYISQNDAQLTQNEIVSNVYTNIDPYNQQIFVKVSSAEDDCFSIGSFWLFSTEGPTIAAPSNLISCGNAEGDPTTIDLTEKTTEIISTPTNPDLKISYYYNSEEAEADQNAIINDEFSTLQDLVIYARVSEEDIECFSIVPFEINLIHVPEPEIAEIYLFCESNDLIIDAGDYDSYAWINFENETIFSDRNVTITSSGKYTLKVVKSIDGVSCERIVEFNVEEGSGLSSFDYKVETFQNKYQIYISTANDIALEYSLNGSDYILGNNFFTEPGQLLLSVRDVNGCTTLSKTILLPSYKRFFSPNEDGINDTWFIFDNPQISLLQTIVYDRFGNIMTTITDQKRGWDGLKNGKVAKADDYWFLAISTNGAEFRGHFALLR
ncbi:gliding motility-associated C-terminal domain-containing protein [Flavobacteriaceae bacterium MAR_2010_188]|nr:gliding motility-associated C-terminal domain-containing protein [Flavobacteriaceae bacterium MAR_2010_188]